MATPSRFIPYSLPAPEPEEMIRRARSFYEWAEGRRTVRDFADRPVPPGVIEEVIRTASTAPSGAHKQPWIFCVVSNPELKRQIRVAAEKEEEENYRQRMSREWLEDLEPFGTDWHKPFLETAPGLIVVFRKPYEIAGGAKRPNYYVSESVGIACGFLLLALYNAGLAALTHTPSPMHFLAALLGRPDNEKPFLLIPVGYPADAATVPVLERKPLDAVLVTYS
jgi:iodotyrosine deiodinase